MLRLLDGLGGQLAFNLKAFAWTPRTVSHYRRETARLLAEVSFGTGGLAVVGGTVGVIAFLTFFTGTEVGLQGYQALNQIGSSAFTGFISAYFNTREIAPLVAALALSATVGCGFTAQLGAMRISEEVDARLRIGLALVLLLALGAAALLGYRWYDRHQLEQAHVAALTAARQFTVDFVSISAGTVDSDLQRISGAATGEFADEFADEFAAGSTQVRAAVVENAVDSKGTVLRAGMVSGDLDSATVLVAIDATVKNVNTPQGRPSHYRMQVELVKDAESDKWLVAKLQFVG